LRSYIVDATEDERRMVTTGAHGRMIARQRETGILWHPDGSAAAFCVKSETGTAMRAEIWRITRAETARLQRAVSQIFQELS
jgi:hypothetical protein